MSVLVPLARHRAAYAPRYTPGSFGDFDRVFNNLFQSALGNLELPAANEGDLAVRMDISETQDGYTVLAELPGLDEKGIELSVDDGLLTLQGEKQAEKEEDGKTFHRTERSFGFFKRVLQLPADADEGSIIAKMSNGVLAIDIAKTKQNTKAAKKIDIARA